jgi:hypothetical protein
MFDFRRVGPRPNVMQIVPPQTAWPQVLTGPSGARNFRNVAGSQIARAEATNIYLGEFWGGSAQKDQLEAFSKSLVENGYLDPLEELNYGAASGIYLGAADLPSDGVKTISDADVRKLIISKVNEGVLHATENSIFVFILEKGIVAKFSDGSNSKERFSGYHDAVSHQGEDVAYIVLPSPWDSPTTSLDPFDAFTAAYAHELAETVTDKIPGKGWVSEDGSETADLEAGGFVAWGPPNLPRRFIVQAYYTNERGPTVGAWREQPALSPPRRFESAVGQPYKRLLPFSAPGPADFFGGGGARQATFVGVNPNPDNGCYVYYYMYVDYPNERFPYRVPIGQPAPPHTLYV